MLASDVMPWMEHAACRGLDPEMFFPPRGGASAPALRVCAACPVRAECLRYAIDEGMHQGVFGGTTSRQRRGMK